MSGGNPGAGTGRVAGGVATTLLAVFLLAGCGQGDVVTEVRSPAIGAGSTAGTGAATGVGGTGCPESGAAEPISPDAEPTAVLRCIGDNEHVPGDGEWSVTVHQKATGRAMLDLIAALRLRSEPRSDGICTADLRMPTVVQLETTSGPVDVAAPTDSCGKSRAEVVNAYQALVWVDVSRARGERLRPEEAVNADCQAWKDMLAIEAQDSPAEGHGPVLAQGAKVKVCLYRSVYPDGWKPSSNTVVDGEPLGGGELRAADADRLAGLLADAGPADPCSAAHHRFAVVFADEDHQLLYVELDGCYRIMTADGTLRQGTKGLADLLSAAL